MCIHLAGTVERLRCQPSRDRLNSFGFLLTLRLYSISYDCQVNKHCKVYHALVFCPICHFSKACGILSGACKSDLYRRAAP